MADKTELRMNLAAIKRIDPYAKDIVDSSAHVAFYTFNSDENEWEKTDVEGVFFIYSRNAEPFHSIFINNRLNTNSFVEPITSQLELQSQPPFLLYRNERSRIRGFWFYNSSECDRIGELIGQLIRECDSKLKVIKNQEIMRSSVSNINIFTMLSKAQEDFNNGQCQSAVAFKEEKRVPMVTSGNNQIDIASESVMNFFAAAKPAAASEVPLFQRLLSNPVPVEQIEKQQRAGTPQDGKLTPPITSTNGDDVRANCPKLSQDLNTSPLAKFLGSTNQLLRKEIFSTEPSHSFLQHSTTTKPALMPPTMFVSSSAGNVPKTTVGFNESLRKSPKPKPEPLTQTQLLQAMVYLMQHDPEFIRKLHEAYLKSFTDMVSL